MADAFEINVAPHNFYGHLSTLMSAHFCAAVPNFRIMELDVDGVPWKDELVTRAPVSIRGKLIIPQAPGWGADVDEAAVRRHLLKLKKAGIVGNFGCLRVNLPIFQLNTGRIVTICDILAISTGFLVLF